jgi:acetyl-CoA carboxylase biotin carboxyl carrier protein
MLKVQEIRELIRAVDQSSLEEFKFEQDGTKLVLRKQKNQVQAVEVPITQTSIPAPNQVQQTDQIVAETRQEPTEAVQTVSNLHTITSPMVGTFYTAPSPDSDPYVAKGDEISQENVVCIIEAMKLLNEIEAEVNGKIVDVLAENGELVEYGQPLFVVEPR